MTVYNGKGGGFVSAGAPVFDDDTNSWTITTTADIADATGMGDLWAERLAGLIDFTGSLDGNADSGGDYPAIIGTSGTITGSVVASGPNVSGTAICTSITETASIEDIGKVTATFEGNDPVGLVLAAIGGAVGTTTGTKYHGKNCAATFDSTTFLNILGWSYTLNAGTADSTGASAAADQTPSRTREVGIFSGTATVTTLQDATQNAKIDLDGAESATLVLKRTAAITALTGTAICTGIENGQDKNGNATANYTFELTGVQADA